MRDVAADILRWLEQGDRVVLATLVHVQSSAPRLPGAHWAVSDRGAMTGSISAGCVESDLVEWSSSVLADGGVKTISYDVADATAMRIGLTCGGTIEVLLERFEGDDWRRLLDAVVAGRPAATAVALAPEEIRGCRWFLAGDSWGEGDAELDGAVVAALQRQLERGGSANLELDRRGAKARVFVDTVLPRPRLVIVGATQTAIPLCRFAREVDFEVIVVDPREVYATEERFGAADRIVREWPEPYFAREAIDRDTYLVTLTHDEKFDVPTLAAGLRSPARYIGALGSRRTHAKRVEQLRAMGFGEDQLARVHAPIGLDLGGRAPAEIALSVVAEIVAERHRPAGERRG